MNTTRNFCLFETALGVCGVAWIENALVNLHLPEASRAATRKRLAAATTSGNEVDVAAAPPWVQAAVATIQAHLRTGRENLAQLPVNFDAVPPFHQIVYRAAMELPPGETSTYGQIAAAAGSAGAARAVGQALGKNPLALVVPCHRVTAAGGKPGGFSAFGGLDTKRKILAIEKAAAVYLLDDVSPYAAALKDAAAHLSKVDPVMAEVMRRVGACRLTQKGRESVFAALAESIVYQQLSGKAAATIYARFRDLFSGKKFPSPDAILGVPEPILRSVGLSRAKAAAIRDLAAKVADGTVPKLKAVGAMTDEEVIEAVVKVRGIGRWTAEMLLMLDLGRLDVLPVDDLGVRKGFAKAYGKRELPDPKALAKFGERWRPYRTVASWYLWRVLDLPSDT